MYLLETLFKPALEGQTGIVNREEPSYNVELGRNYLSCQSVDLPLNSI